MLSKLEFEFVITLKRIHYKRAGSKHMGKKELGFIDFVKYIQENERIMASGLGMAIGKVGF